MIEIDVFEVKNRKNQETHNQISFNAGSYSYSVDNINEEIPTNPNDLLKFIIDLSKEHEKGWILDSEFSRWYHHGVCIEGEFFKWDDPPIKNAMNCWKKNKR